MAEGHTTQDLVQVLRGMRFSGDVADTLSLLRSLRETARRTESDDLQRVEGAIRMATSNVERACGMERDDKRRVLHELASIRSSAQTAAARTKSQVSMHIDTLHGLSQSRDVGVEARVI